MRGLLLLLAALCPTLTIAQPVVQVAAPSQEALWDADKVYYATLQLPKEKQDWDKVLAAYKKSADLKHPEAMKKMGEIYLRLGMEKEAQSYLNMANDIIEKDKRKVDESIATYQLILNSEDCAAPRNTFEQLAKQGTILFNARLGDIYTSGKCGDKNTTKGIWYYSNGALLGSGLSQFKFADFLVSKNFVAGNYGNRKQNQARALAYYYIAAKGEPSDTMIEKFDKSNAWQKFISLRQLYVKNPENVAFFNNFIYDLCGLTQACWNVPPDLVNPILDNKFDIRTAE